VISLNGEVIVIASGDIAKVCRRQRFSRECFELHDVQDLRGGRDWGKRLQKRARRWDVLGVGRARGPHWQASQAPEYRTPRHAYEFAHRIPRINVRCCSIIADGSC
jgi:hypothetical protein